MGQIVRHAASRAPRFPRRPGDQAEWARAAVAIALGATTVAVLTALGLATPIAVTGGLSTTTVIAGFNFGRRDAHALAAVRGVTVRAAGGAASRGTLWVAGGAASRGTLWVAGGAAWRGTLQGFAGAGAALVIAHLPAHGLAADWLLPPVPVVLGALARQAGMFYERMGGAGQDVLPTTLRSLRPSADRVPGAAL